MSLTEPKASRTGVKWRSTHNASMKAEPYNPTPVTELKWSLITGMAVVMMFNPYAFDPYLELSGM